MDERYLGNLDEILQNGDPKKIVDHLLTHYAGSGFTSILGIRQPADPRNGLYHKIIVNPAKLGREKTLLILKALSSNDFRFLKEDANTFIQMVPQEEQDKILKDMIQNPDHDFQETVMLGRTRSFFTGEPPTMLKATEKWPPPWTVSDNPPGKH